jgi:anti-sigma B factor antagonist
MPLLEATHVVDAEGRAMLRVDGEIDLATARDLVAAATDGVDPAEPLRLDLGGVTFIDSTGISALLEIRRAALEAGSRVELVTLSPAVEKVLALAGLTAHFAAEHGGEA